jgi:hypothetical protein
MSLKKNKPLKSKEDNKIEYNRGKISFLVWFDKQVIAGKLRFWQKKELSVFFKEKGLSDNEEPDKYSELLKLY